MRSAFRDQLEGLWTQMTELAQLQVVAIERASSALLDANRQLAELVITEQDVTEQLQADLEINAMQLLAKQQPVATDLRLVLATLPVSTALARMGGLAQHVAKATRLRAPESAVADKVRRTMTEIGGAATEIAGTLTRAIQERDAQLAAEVAASDDGMDALHRQLLTQLLAADWPHGVPAAVDAALLGRYYERFSDQAVSVARRIRYVITGAVEDR
ncbi:phosphate signaling complex protein PhoU [uncultured Jatrophihabitans sp.]|uniref:phosphate signaling complex protein PhoU n=1 Tax=uncultured Jatrophihabitans sp. TaxID=1610747 RepID=UPI0035CB37D6